MVNFRLALETQHFNENLIRRWRHCSCFVNQTNKIILFGGLTSMSNPTNDTLCFQPNGQLIPSEVEKQTNSCEIFFIFIEFIQFSDVKPSNRHSARLNSYKQYAILSGGLLENNEPTNEIWFLDTTNQSMTWKLFPTKGHLIPRYEYNFH